MYMNEYKYLILQTQYFSQLFNNTRYFCINRAGIAQAVHRLATRWAVRGSNTGGGEIFRSHPDRPRDPPSLLYNGYRVLPGGKAAGAWR